jgi:hypothetical protein
LTAGEIVLERVEPFARDRVVVDVEAPREGHPRVDELDRNDELVREHAQNRARLGDRGASHDHRTKRGELREVGDRLGDDAREKRGRSDTGEHGHSPPSERRPRH